MSQLLSAAAGLDKQWLTSASILCSQVYSAPIALRYECHSYFCKTQALLRLFTIHTLVLHYLSLTSIRRHVEARRLIRLSMRTCWQDISSWRVQRAQTVLKKLMSPGRHSRKHKSLLWPKRNYVVDRRNICRIICFELFYRVFFIGMKICNQYVTHDPTAGACDRNPGLVLIQKVIFSYHCILLSHNISCFDSGVFWLWTVCLSCTRAKPIFSCYKIKK